MTRARVVYLIATVSTLILLAYLQFKRSRKLREIPWYGWDEPIATLGHLVGYFILALAFTLTFQRRNLSFRKYLLFILPVLLIGLGFEVIQLFLPTRNFNVFDISANILGISLAYIPSRAIMRSLYRIGRTGIRSQDH